MKIILIGFMGSGKSTVAPLLAQKLGLRSIEMDDLIVVKAGGKAIKTIFSEGGEMAFRELETAVAKDLQTENDVVISTGGGVVTDKINLKYLGTQAVVVELLADFDTSLRRIGSDIPRPLFEDVPAANALYKQRAPIYQAAASLHIDTTNKPVEAIAEEIARKVKAPASVVPKQCLTIGDPVAHSLSPTMHNAGYKNLGIDNEYRFAAELVKPEELQAAVESIRQRQIRGVAVTLPHKETIMRYLDNIDDTAQKIGAVNTVVNENGVLTGYNTDWVGVVRPLRKITNLQGKKTAILGAGGAARAAVYGLSQEGANVTIFNRTLDKAQTLATEFGWAARPLEDLDAVKNMDIIFNATPLGLAPREQETPLPKGFITNQQIVFDAIYAPYETRLLKEAGAQGAQVIHGSEMLLEQGFAQFKLFTGLDAPEAVMRNALLEALGTSGGYREA